jgi:hypothetical protein
MAQKKTSDKMNHSNESQPLKKITQQTTKQSK